MFDPRQQSIDLPDDLEEIARSIPPFPRTFSLLRQQMALLPNALAAVTQGSLPADEIGPPDNAVDTLSSGIASAGTGPGTIDGGALVPGTVGTQQLAPGSITIAKLRTGIRPVQLVDALPALPDSDYPPGEAVVLLSTDGQLYRNFGDVWTANVPAGAGGIEPVGALPALPDATYPIGSVVYLTTDGKLYRNVANAWTAAVAGADVTGTVAAALNAAHALLADSADEVAAADIIGQIATAQIADDAITAAKIGALAVTAGKIAANAVTATELAALSVTTAKLDANAVTTAKIAADAVTAGEIAAGAVGTTELDALAVTTAKIAGDAVTTAKIAAAAVQAAQIDAAAVTTTKIADDAITTPKLVANAVTAAKIAALTITAAEIAAGTITAAKIAAGTITTNEIAALTITAGNIAASAITTAKLDANAVTAAKIAAATITSAEIAAGTIVAANIAAGTITATELGALSVTTAKLDALAVTAAKIAANTITAAQIAANTITAAQIAAGTITATEIAALTITAGNIAALAITTAKLDANAVTAAKIAAHTITAGEIAAGTITATEIAATTITAAKIAAGTITATEIAAATILAANIAAATITGDRLVAGTITASLIAAATITATQIASRTITADRIVLGTLSAAEIAAGAIQIGHFADNPSNLVPNSGFEQDGDVAASTAPTGWTASSKITVATTSPDSGGQRSLVMTQSGSLAAITTDTAAYIQVQGGRKVRIEVRVAGKATNNAAAAGRIRLFYYKADKTAAAVTSSTVVSTIGATTTYAVVGEYRSLASDVVYVKIELQMDNAGALADVLYFDNVRLYYVDNNLNAASGNVLIDDTGITISNGSLVIQDEFGATSMSSTGFAGSWADFINTNIYNSAFKAGTAGVVGLGRTSALPFWTVANEAGSPVLTFLNPGLKFTFAAIGNIKKVSSDLIPVLPMDNFHVLVDYDVTRVAGTLELTIEVVFWDQTKVFSASVGETSVSGATAVSIARSTFETSLGSAGNYYAQIILRAKETVANNSGNIIDVYAVGLPRHGSAFAAMTATSLALTTTFSAADVSITGGGPLRLGLTSALAAVTTEGYAKWDDTSHGLVVGDSVRAKPVTPWGWQHIAVPQGWADSAVLTTALNLAAVSGANGGAVMVPFMVDAPMTLSGYRLRSTDTSLQRVAEARLYYSKLNNSATATYVAGTAAAWNFTPAAASNRDTTLTGGDVVIAPGFYWLVVRNTGGARTFGIGTTASAGPMAVRLNYQQAIAALGATIDLVTGWGAASSIVGAVLMGRLPDGTTAPTA